MFKCTNKAKLDLNNCFPPYRFGRRILLLTSNLLLAVAGTCTAFASSFTLFCLFRFFCGMAMSGIILNSFSLSEDSYTHTLLLHLIWLSRLNEFICVPLSLSFLYSCRMDPHSHTDWGRYSYRLLLHHWAADPGRGGLQHPKLALAHSGRLSTFLCFLPLLLVSSKHPYSTPECQF